MRKFLSNKHLASCEGEINYEHNYQDGASVYNSN